MIVNKVNALPAWWSRADAVDFYDTAKGKGNKFYVPGNIATMMLLLRRSVHRSVIHCGKRGSLS